MSTSSTIRQRNSFCLHGQHESGTLRTSGDAAPDGKGPDHFSGVVAGPFAGVPGSSAAEIYDPSTETFSTTGSMATGRVNHESVLLADGRVLIVGGSDGTNYLSSSEIYDPSKGTFSSSGSMASPRYALRAALLSDGKVLALGGGPAISVYLATAELYDPISGTFSPTGAMSIERDFPTIVTLPDGSILVTGGGVVAGPLGTAEIYHPASGTFASTGNMTSPRYGHTATVLPSGLVLVTGGDRGGASKPRRFSIRQPAPFPRYPPWPAAAYSIPQRSSREAAYSSTAVWT